MIHLTIYWVILPAIWQGSISIKQHIKLMKKRLLLQWLQLLKPFLNISDLIALIVCRFIKWWCIFSYISDYKEQALGMYVLWTIDCMVKICIRLSQYEYSSIQYEYYVNQSECQKVPSITSAARRPTPSYLEADSSYALKEHEILFKMPQTRRFYLN